MDAEALRRMIFVLATTVGGIAAGYLCRRALFGLAIGSEATVLRVSRLMKLVAFFILQPVAIVGTFWSMSLAAVQLLLFPVLGVVSLLVGGSAALLLVRLFRIPPERAASVFASGMFTNLLTFGGLVGFVFFGQEGYVLAQLYSMFVTACYFLVGYPVSHNIARGVKPVLRPDAASIRRNRFLIIPPIAMAIGLLLNWASAGRPAFMDPLISFLVPCISVILGFSIGLSLRFSTVREYRREIGLVVLIKFAIVPAVMIPIGALLGLPGIDGGVPFRMLVVLSFMPVAFNALVPPAVFGFDLNLANSAWLVTTAGLIVIVPLLYLALV